MSRKPEAEEIERRRALARQTGGAEWVARQHGEGTYTSRGRINGLLDTGSLTEYGSSAGAGTYADGRLVSLLSAPNVMGTGRVDGRPVCVGGEDFTVQGGSSLMEMQRWKGGRGSFGADLAWEYKLPLVLLIDGSGANVGSVRQIRSTYLPRPADWSRSMELVAEVPVVGRCSGRRRAGLPRERCESSRVRPDMLLPPLAASHRRPHVPQSWFGLQQ